MLWQTTETKLIKYLTKYINCASPTIHSCHEQHEKLVTITKQISCVFYATLFLNELTYKRVNKCFTKCSIPRSHGTVTPGQVIILPLYTYNEHR